MGGVKTEIEIEMPFILSSPMAKYVQSERTKQQTDGAAVKIDRTDNNNVTGYRSYNKKLSKMNSIEFLFRMGGVKK